jgi:hypothetical protein
MMFCVMFKSSKLNEIHIIILLYKKGWFGDKKINFHPWGSRINSHK